MNFRINFRTFMIISNMSIINLHIRDSEMIDRDRDRQDLHSISNHRDMIKRTTIRENINHENINHAIISISQIIRTNQFLFLSFISIQYHKTILTEIKDHFSLQIKLQTTTNINHDLIHSKIFHHSRMIRRLIKFVRIEIRDLLNFRVD